MRMDLDACVKYWQSRGYDLGVSFPSLSSLGIERQPDPEHRMDILKELHEKSEQWMERWADQNIECSPCVVGDEDSGIECEANWDGDFSARSYSTEIEGMTLDDLFYMLEERVVYYLQMDHEYAQSWDFRSKFGRIEIGLDIISQVIGAEETETGLRVFLVMYQWDDASDVDPIIERVDGGFADVIYLPALEQS